MGVASHDVLKTAPRTVAEIDSTIQPAINPDLIELVDTGDVDVRQPRLHPRLLRGNHVDHWVAVWLERETVFLLDGCRDIGIVL